jgi:hypothetical protein
MFTVIDLTVDDFKASTLRKLESVHCPLHGESPRVMFQGSSLREVRISIRSCCAELSTRANHALAASAEPTSLPKLPH